MSKHEEKNCPRCGKPFECRVGDILNCQCHGVSCSQEAIAMISETYDDCLCRECLVSINSNRQSLQPTPGSSGNNVSG